MDIAIIGPVLHDRATRGESLTSQERANLESWYATQDRIEAAQLGLGAVRNAESITRTASLQRQIDELLAQISVVAGQLQTLVAQNSALRQENSKLQQKLARYLTVEAA